AGAALPGAQAQGPRAALLGDRGRRPRLALQQLPRPLPLASPRPDGRALRVPVPRPRRAGPGGRAARVPRQARHERRRGVGPLARGRHRAHTPLLRDRRPQHLARVPALRIHARTARRRGSRARARGRALGAGLERQAAPRALSRGVAGESGRVKRSEPETVTVGAMSQDGRGIAAIGGKKVFVPGALRGETVRILRRRRHRHFDEAELLDVLEPSPQRVVPRCAVYGVCGGCSLQHLPVADQRALKQDALADTLARIGGVAPRRWLPPVYDEAGEWHYRRRARLAVKDVPGKGRVLVGFRERHTPYVTEMLRCEVLAAPLDALPGPLSELVGRLSIRRRVPQIEAA